MHSVAHCIFLHPYVDPTVDRDLWNLACDIAAENAVSELCGKRSGKRGDEINSALRHIESELGSRITAEKLYNRLKQGTWKAEVEKWSQLFLSDTHGLWYEPPESPDDGEAESDESTNPNDGESQRKQKDSSRANGGGAPQDLPHAGEDADDQDAVGHDEQSSKRDQGDIAGEGQGVVLLKEGGAALSQVARPSADDQVREWREVATSLAINLQTMSAKRGSQLGGFIEDLQLAAQPKVDYADFLRQFAIPGEVMRLSDDEFDYVFYTYGLKLYGNLPLIEPLEYREEKRIREFVIVIDTSGSVQGDIVRRFIETTFSILKSTEAFFEKVHIRIIQCDAQVQSDDKVTSLEELKEWGEGMRIFGGGGTDFRPAFRHVDKLVEDGEFENLGGLVYFTDGWGEYPEWMPQYKTAFVFYDEDYRPEDVPPWAVQIVMDQDSVNAEHNL